MILRKKFTNLVNSYCAIFPIVAIIGPRQVGKTTLALEYSKQFSDTMHFDLEDPVDFEKLKYPHHALPNNKQLIIIDEIQKAPELFPFLRVFVDKNPHVHLLILGSCSPDVRRQSGESLAGRVGYIELTPLSVIETGNMLRVWEKGGYPKAYLAQTEAQSQLWMKNYIASFLERDLSLLGFGVDSYLMRKLWMMIAHYHANLVNYSELGRSLNFSNPTIKKYLSILEKTFMIRLLEPWHENISKRQVKQPKVYIRDSGVLHYFLGVGSQTMHDHPKIGASWEGFALEEVIRIHRAESSDCYFWRTQDGAELDLLIVLPGKRLGFEFKFSEQVQITRSMKIALADLGLDKITLVTPYQKEPYWMGEQVEVLSLEQYASRVDSDL